MLAIASTAWDFQMLCWSETRPPIHLAAPFTGAVYQFVRSPERHLGRDCAILRYVGAGEATEPTPGLWHVVADDGSYGLFAVALPAGVVVEALRHAGHDATVELGRSLAGRSRDLRISVHDIPDPHASVVVVRWPPPARPAAADAQPMLYRLLARAAAAELTAQIDRH